MLEVKCSPTEVFSIFFILHALITHSTCAPHMRTAHAHRTWRSDVAASMVEACVRVFSHFQPFFSAFSAFSALSARFQRFQRFFSALSSLDDGCGAC
jgi:hypothetical protein